MPATFHFGRGILTSLLALAPLGGGLAIAGPYTESGVAANDPSIVGWATGVQNLSLGPVDITDPTGAKASFGTPADALGPATATADSPYPVISLGDGGSITLSFSVPITNGPGADLAVFENGFQLPGNAGLFLELAFVSVSSDGVNFFTFPSISLTQTTTQVGSFGALDPTNIHNLAGKFVAGFGTPFDLNDLAGIPQLDLNHVLYVKITDVVGDIDPAYATKDSTGHIINDPWETDFASGGFDLDGVAVLASVPEPSGLALVGLCGILSVAYRRRNRR